MRSATDEVGVFLLWLAAGVSLLVVSAMLAGCAVVPTRTVMTQPPEGFGAAYAEESGRYKTCLWQQGQLHGKNSSRQADFVCWNESRNRCINRGLEPDCGTDGAP